MSQQVELVDVEEISIENYALGQGWSEIDHQEHFGVSEQAQQKLLSSTLKNNQEELLIKENISEISMKQEGHLQKCFIRCNFKDLIVQDPSARTKFRSMLVSPKLEASNSLVKSLPYFFIKAQGIPPQHRAPVPANWIRKMKNEVQQYRNEQMKSLALYSTSYRGHPIFKVITANEKKEKPVFYGEYKISLRISIMKRI